MNEMYAAFIKNIKRSVLFLLTLNRVAHLAKQTSEVVCHSTAAVFFLIIISSLKSCVPSHSWNYNERYVCGRCYYEQHIGSLGSCLECQTLWQWYHSKSDTCFLKLFVVAAWKSSGCKFGITAECSLHLWADRWVESRPCMQIAKPCRCRDPFLQNCWDSAPLRMCWQAQVQQTSTLRKNARRRKTHHYRGKIW